MKAANAGKVALHADLFLQACAQLPGYLVQSVSKIRYYANKPKENSRGLECDLAKFPEVAMHQGLWQGLPGFGGIVIGLLQTTSIHMLHHQQQAVCAGVINHLCQQVLCMHHAGRNQQRCDKLHA